MEKDPQQVLSSQPRGHFHVPNPPAAAALNEGARLGHGWIPALDADDELRDGASSAKKITNRFNGLDQQLAKDAASTAS
jgi:hypothetical protein